MSIHRWFTPLLVLVLAASGSATGAESARLRYRLRPGASYEAVLKGSLAMQLEGEGLPEDVASAVFASKDIAEQVRVGVRLAASALAQDGSTPLRGSFQDLYTKMTLGGATFESSDFKDQLVPMVLDGRVTPDGRSIELDLTNAGSDLPAPAREAIGRLLHVLPSFPDRDLAVGDKFEAPLRFDMPGLPSAGDTNVDGTCVYTLSALTPRDADFTIRCSMSALTNDTAQNMKMAIKGGSEGSARFDRSEGIFRTIRTDLDVNMALEMKPEEDAKDPAAGSRLVKIRASAKGPLELTMGVSGAATETPDRR